MGRLARYLLFAHVAALATSPAWGQSCPLGPNIEVLGGVSGPGAGLELLAIETPLVGLPFGLEVRGGPPGAVGHIITGRPSEPVFLDQYSAFLYVGQTAVLVKRFVLDAEGAYSMQTDAVPLSHCGVTSVLQAGVLDAQAPGGLAISNGLSVRFGSTQIVAPSIDALPAATVDMSVTVTGTGLLVGDSILIEGGLTPSVAAVERDLTFSVDVPLRLNAVNTLIARELFADGSESPTTAVQIVQDGSPPSLAIDFPASEGVLYEATTIVAGRVSDLLSGIEGLEVTVNGILAEVDPANGANATFEATGVPVSPTGATLITAVARDALGNERTEAITVTFQALGGLSLQALSGGGQSGTTGTELLEPIVVSVQRPDGTPFAGKLVTFRVTQSDGRLAPTQGAPDPGKLSLQVFADSNGLANAFWTLGSDAGCGNQRVEVSANGLEGTAYFSASANPNAASQLNLTTGNQQRGAAGSTLPMPIKVWVNDGLNGIAGVPVTFRVLSGTGSVSDDSTSGGLIQVTRVTDGTGHASAAWTLGVEPGNNVVDANFPENPRNAVRFTATGLAADGGLTRFRGLVLDNAMQPLGGAHCEIDAGGMVVETFSLSDGSFFFDDVPQAGAGHLHVDGATVDSVGGGQPLAGFHYPALEFEVVLVAQTENALPTPVLLPRIDEAGERLFDGTQDVVLSMADVEGLEMRVAAGTTATFPDGSVVGPGNPILMSISQVHRDDIPMPMPDGASPPVAWTLQPGGLHFDPPIEIRYPNLSGLAPGAIANFLTFDHATGRFEIVGVGAVDDQGAQIVSVPGSGLSLSGWGGICPPYALSSFVERCNITCVDEGEITGVVAVSASDFVCLGNTITFDAFGGVDSGGERLVECEGSSTVETLPPAEVRYDFVVTRPDGTTQAGTNASTVPIQANQTGEYTCTFTAYVQRKCAPAPVTTRTVTCTALLASFVELDFPDYGYDDFTEGGPYMSVQNGDVLVSNVELLILPAEVTNFFGEVVLQSGSPTVLGINTVVNNNPQDVLVDGLSVGESPVYALVNDLICERLVAHVYDGFTMRVGVVIALQEVDDVQVIPLNQGLPFAVCVEAGADGVLQTTPTGDDTLDVNTITTGPDGICDTVAAFEDESVIPLNEGASNAICVIVGPNQYLDSTPGGDDQESLGAFITTGLDGICQTEAKTVPDAVAGVNAGDTETYLSEVIFNQAAITDIPVDDLGSVTVGWDVDHDGLLDEGTSEPGLILAAIPNTELYDQIVVIVPDFFYDGGEEIFGYAYYNQKFSFVAVPKIIAAGQDPHNVIAHEIGHAFVGLEHTPADPVNLMHPTAASSVALRLRRAQWNKLHGIRTP